MYGWDKRTGDGAEQMQAIKLRIRNGLVVAAMLRVRTFAIYPGQVVE
jgi:hypothetical protein